MSEFITTGEWIAKAGQADEFIGAWEMFASWAAGMPGASQLRLTQDLGEPQRFVSFGSWNDLDLIHAWKADREFRTKMSTVQQHVAEFHPAELEVVRVVEA
jgi:heme-degrading monooxygenase HmoA